MGRALPEGAQGRGMPRPQTLRRRKRPRVGLAPLSKGAGCGESRRLGDCLEAGSRSRKAAQGGYFAGGGRFRGRHFGAGQSLRPRLAARPPPFDKGGKLQGGACGQPGNHDLDVIANPCRGRFYIGPVCDAANVRGRIWNPPLQWGFHGIRPPRVAGHCRKARRGGACPARKPCGGANTPGGYGIRPYMGFPRYPAAPGCGFFRNSSAPGNGLPVWLPPR